MGAEQYIAALRHKERTAQAGPRRWASAGSAALLAVLLLAASANSWDGSGRQWIAARFHQAAATAEVADAARPSVATLPPTLLRQFACVTATADYRHPLTKAMRGWRRGIPTLVLTNATGQLLARERAEGRRFGETWLHYPDVPRFNVTRKAGDPRAAAGPALALKHLGADFKWLIYGDDDVAFFWPGLLRALQGLDPKDPYFLSDNYYSRWLKVGKGQGRLDQPRCVPCTVDTKGLDLAATHALKTCNCSVAAVHRAFRALRTRPCFKANATCPPVYAVAGGAGAVLSIGLLHRLDPRLYLSCIHGGQAANGVPEVAGGSDGLLTNCLWQQGFAYTDPGFELRHKGQLTFNGHMNNWQRMNRDFADTLVGGCQQEQCRLPLDSAVSVHTGGRGMKNYTLSSLHVGHFLHLAAEYAAERADVVGLVARLRG